MELEVAIEEPWPAGQWEAIAIRCAASLIAVTPELASPRLAASILFTCDDELRALNSQWRDRDKPTNVLSFPMLQRAELLGLSPEGPPVLLGDVALAFETCAREAADKGISVEQHAAHLVVHGLLHLAGHDHELGTEEAEAMEALEVKALALIGVPDPYERRDQGQG